MPGSRACSPLRTMISEWVFPSLNIPTQRSSEDYIKHASQITFSDLVLGGLISPITFRLDGGVAGIQERFRGPPGSLGPHFLEKLDDLFHQYPK